MNKPFSLVIAAVFIFLSPFALATQADDTTITIDAQTPGATPFIDQLTLTASETSVSAAGRMIWGFTVGS